MAKIYTVVKDGETVKELKTLAAAKKLADAECAEYRNAPAVRLMCLGDCSARHGPHALESREGLARLLVAGSFDRLLHGIARTRGIYASAAGFAEPHSEQLQKGGRES